MELEVIDDLHVRFETKLGTVRAVNGVSLNVRQGGVLGLVGESGCGKSITAFTVMQLVAPPGTIAQDQPRRLRLLVRHGEPILPDLGVAGSVVVLRRPRPEAQVSAVPVGRSQPRTLASK